MLVCTLLCLVFVALFLTVSTLSMLLLGRLLFLVRASGPRSGLSTWNEEVRDKLQRRSKDPHSEHEGDIAVKSEQSRDQDGNITDDGHVSDSGSTVVVEGLPDDAKLNGVKTE
jgi:hypothetical protein